MRSGSQLAHFLVQFKTERQRLTTQSKKVLEDDQKVGDVSETTFYIKDLGPQLSWRTVFMIEYVCSETFTLLDATDRPSLVWPNMDYTTLLLLPASIWFSRRKNKLRPLRYAEVRLFGNLLCRTCGLKHYPDWCSCWS